MKLRATTSRVLRFAASRLGLIILLVLYAIPIIWMVATSLKSNVAIFANPASLVFSPTFSAYAKIWTQGTLGTAALNSVIIAVSTMVLTLLIAIPAAYGLDRARGAFLSVGLALLVLFQMVPQTASVIPLYRILGTWKLLGSLAGVILADTAMLTPFTVLIIRPFVRSVPVELEEAAEIDGAGTLTSFVRVVLPLIANGIATAAAIVFILAWGEFLYAISFLSNPQSYPISALISQEISSYGTSWSGLMALAVVGSLPILLVYIVAQRRLASGLSLGAVK
jgi:multiple sugar transport system permease protein